MDPDGKRRKRERGRKSKVVLVGSVHEERGSWGGKALRTGRRMCMGSLEGDDAGGGELTLCVRETCLSFSYYFHSLFHFSLLCNPRSVRAQ